MAKKRIGTCEIKWCQAENQPVIHVNETIGDGSFNVDICEDCAGILGLEPGDDLPYYAEEVRKKLKAAGKKRWKK